MDNSWYNSFIIKKFNSELYEQNSYSSSIYGIRNKHPKLSLRQAFFKLKTLYNFNDQCIIVDQLSKNFNRYIYGIPLPRTLKELGNSEYIFESDSIEDEINWFFISLRKFENEINEFIKYKAIFDKYLLKGMYKEALHIIELVENKICISIWSIENRLLIKEMTEGLEENKLFLNEVNDSQRFGHIVSLADFLSKRAEKDLTANKYKNDIANSLSRVKGNFKKETIEYYNFKTNYYDLYRYTQLTAISSIEFQNSIIDRYLSFIRILQDFILREDLKNDQLEMLKSRLNYAAKRIEDDVLLENMILFLDPTYEISKRIFNNQAIEILDFYSEGKYDLAKEKSVAFILDNPLAFEFYEVYAKCLLNTNSGFIPLNREETFQNLLLKEVFLLLEKKTLPEYSEQNLLKIALQLESTPLAVQINNFVLYEMKEDNSLRRKSLLNCSFLNPMFSYLYTNKENSNIFFKQAQLVYQNSSTLKFLSQKINYNLKQPINRFNISENRKITYLALYHQELEEYDKAIILWLGLKGSNTNPPHVLEKIIINLYKCYFYLNQLDNCLELLVKTYFQNPHLIIKLNADIIRKKIREERFRNVSPSIYLPIFYFITGSEESAICNSYELFLFQHKVKTPSELIRDLPKNLDKKYLIFFLDNVCNVDTFKHSIFIEGSEQRLQERLNICKFLEETDPVHSSKYIEEVSSIEKQALVQQGLQEYDESKIFINKKMIVNSLLKELEADFQRYYRLDSILGDRSILLMSPQGINSITLKKEGSHNKSNSDSPFSESPLFDMVKEMFLEVRNKFLSSEYGLSAYLSTRIRHGVFEGEVRPQFEKLKLITEKDSESGIYKVNDFWESKINKSRNFDEQKFQNQLSKFSQNVDGLINSVVKKYLQIKLDNENKEGWFDYEFQDEIIDKDLKVNPVSLGELYLKLQRNKNFDSFVNFSFELLWHKTDINLSTIRSELKGTITNNFERIIEDLENNLLLLINKEELPELFQNINTSKVNVQNDLDRISRWFNRSGTQIKDFYINKVVEITKENTNKHYEGKNKSIALTENIDTDILIKGEYLPYLIDLMKIFFDNILKHTNQISGPVPTQINISTDLSQNLMFLNIHNDLFGDIEFEKDKIDDYLKKFKADIGKALTETNSGFHKAIRILKSDLGVKSNEIKIGTNDKDKFYIKCTINIQTLLNENINS